MKGIAMLTRMTGKMTMLSLLIALAMLFAVSTSFAGAPAKNDYTALVDSGAVLQPDATPQAIGTTTVALTSGGLSVSTYTITILGTSTVTAGEVTAVDISDGTNTWSASGSYGPGSVVACTASGVTPVDAATMTIRLTLAPSSAGKTVGVELTSEDGGNQTGLPTAGSLHNIYAPADTLSVTTNTPVASSASPGAFDVQMQYLQVDSDTGGNGQVEITTVTVDDIGAAAGADIDNINVYIDDDANLGNGDLGKIVAAFTGAQLNVDMTAISAANRTVTNGTSKYIWITYDINSGTADGTAIQSSVTAIAVAGGDNGASGTWSSNNFNVSAGPSNALTSCADCHDYPPADSATRGNPEGAVVGDHQVHIAYTCNFCHVVPATETSSDFAHRDGDITMKDGTIGDAGTGDNGVYNKGTGGVFAQSNAPTTATCSNVDCHNNNDTPQWGVGTTDCESCHGAPPNTNAHTAHYTAKGWANPDTAGANCATCHPGDHDGLVEVNVGLTPGGSGGTTTCSTTGTGCHNGNITPTWSTTPIACTNCHTVGGSNTASVANPVSGLHNMSAAGVQKHDNSISGNACEECHTKASISGHWDGTASATADYTAVNVGISFASGSYTDAGGTGSSRGTCNSTCHADGGSWERQWSTAADSAVTTAGDTRCDVCHGQFGNWRVGSSHEGTFGGSASTRGSSHNSLTGASNGCEDCHSYPSLSNHENNFITMNDGGSTTVTNAAGRIYCASCHSDDGAPTTSGTHTFPASGFTLETVSGANDPVGDCSGCHGGGTTGANADNYWPDDNVAQTHAGNDDPSGRHLFHVTQIANALYGENIATLLTDNGNGTADDKQKAVCEYCHQAVTNDGDHTNTLPAEVFPSGTYAKFLDGTADGGTVASYDAGLDTCSNVDCHNSKVTADGTYGWYDAGTSACLMCHTVGGAGANPTSGAHNLTQAGTTAHDDNFGSGYGCTDCHQSPATNAHIDGTTNNPNTATFNWNLTGKTITLNALADNTDNTCTATTCHSDGGDWERQWSTAADSTATAAGSARCDVCHGQFNNWRTGTSHAAANEQNRGDTHNSLGGVANGCEDCHVYPTSSGNHNNGSININNAPGVTSAGGRTWCSGCHTDDGAPATAGTHTFEQSTFTRVEVPGPNDPVGDCTACHKTGQTGVATPVTSTSPHVITTVGGVFNACTDCHPGGLVGSQHTATGVISIANQTSLGIDYVDGVNGSGAYSGFNGIVLGGDAADPTGKTEAEWCWSCHAAQTPDISEWDGSSATYDYGTVTQDDLNWTTTSWQSANFAYKNGPLSSPPGAQTNSSTHGTNGGATGVDAVGNISCTFCHDVHDTQGPTGGPYVRGTWQSNPYPEDGAPRSGEGQTINSGYFGLVPRGDQNNNYGGYQIDQNNGSPALTADSAAGLCELCHGNADGTWTTAELSAIGGSTGWVSTGNSHAYVVKGGLTTGGYNLYKESDRLPISGFTSGSSLGAGARAGRPSMAYKHHTVEEDGYGFRGTDGRSFVDTPSITGASRPYGMSNYGWGATVDTNTTNGAFHQFSCSKCHNPHASRLPRLMITNCLDTKVNTWDDTLTVPAQGTSNGQGTDTVSQENGGVHYSNATSAQNCHRLKDPAEPNSGGPGWNTVTPW